MATFDATLSGSKATSYVSLARAVELVTDTPQEANLDWHERAASCAQCRLHGETLAFAGTLRVLRR